MLQGGKNHYEILVRKGHKNMHDEREKKKKKEKKKFGLLWKDRLLLVVYSTERPSTTEPATLVGGKEDRKDHRSYAMACGDYCPLSSSEIPVSGILSWMP